MTAANIFQSHRYEDGRRDGLGEEFSFVFRELLEARTRQGLLKKELARACGMRADYFSHLLSGRRRPTHRETVDRIAAGLSLDEKSKQRLMRAAGFAEDPAGALRGPGRRPPRTHRDRQRSIGPVQTGRSVPNAPLVTSGSSVTSNGIGMWCDAGLRSRLSPKVWESLVSEGVPRTYARGETLILEGEADTRVMVLVEGRVKVTCNQADGTEVLLAIRGAGDIVGEHAAIDKGVRSATVSALRPCRTRVLIAQEFMRFVNRHDLALTMLQLAVARERENQTIRVELSTLSVRRRLVRMLLRLVEALGDPTVGPVVVDLGIPQEELAHAIGSSRGHVAAHLARLRAAGVVMTGRRGIVVRDPARLRAIDARRYEGPL